MAGAADLMEALTGGGNLQRDAYNKELARLTAAKSQQALMDRRVAEAFTAVQEQEAFKRMIDGGLEDAVIAGISGRLKDQEEFKIKQIQQEQLANAASMMDGMVRDPNNDALDLFNRFIALSGNKLITPAHTNVNRQSLADARHSEASAEADEALAIQREKRNEEIEVRTNIARRRLENMDVDIPPSSIMQQAFPDVVDPENPDYMIQNPDLERFYGWWGNYNLTNDRKVPFTEAYTEYRRLKNTAPSAAEAFTGAGRIEQARDTGRQGPGKNPSIYGSRAAVEAAIANGTLQSGDTFYDPNGVLREVP
jgi:hypothetical protein